MEHGKEHKMPGGMMMSDKEMKKMMKGKMPMNGGKAKSAPRKAGRKKK